MPAARTLIVLAVLLSLPTSTAGAQTALGDIQGVVTDGSGRALAGVTVTITNTATRGIREAMTDDAGRFAAPGLPAGPYEVQASLQGFATRRQLGAVVHAGRVLALRLELGTAPAPETITIAGSAPVVDAARVHGGSVVTSVEIENLPVRTRRVSELRQLTPGVVPAAAGASVNGLLPAFTRTVVDGADLAEAPGGELEAPQVAVHEITVDTSAYPARDGRAGAGVVTLVTKSGTDQLNGSAFQFFGHSALNATDAVNELLDLPKDSYRSNQFGGALGGALVENRHFAFGAYEGHRTSETNAVFLNVPPGVPNDGNSRTALDRLRQSGGSWERRLNRDLALVRTDHQLVEGQQLTLRYQHHDASGIGLDEAGPQTARDAARDLTTSKRAFSAAAASTLGERLGNEALLLISKDRVTSDSAASGPHATVRQAGSDVLRIGPDAMHAGESTVTRLQLVDTVTWVNGAHKVRSGLDVQFDHVEASAGGHYRGAYFFNSLSGFGRGAPLGAGDAYVQAFEGGTGRTVRPDTTDVSLFVQDEWRVNREVTATYGLRYDMQRFARTDARPADPQLAAAGIDSREPDGTSGLGPRLGAAWAPAGRRIVARGAYGLVIGRTPWSMLAAAHAYDGINVRTMTFRGAGGDPVPAFPNRFANLPAGSSNGSVVVFDPDYRNARVHHATAGAEWEWMPDTSVAASYVFVNGTRLPRAADINFGPATPVTLTVADPSGRPAGPIGHYRFASGPFTGFDRVISYGSTAESRYDGLSFELRRRYSQGHSYRLVYTLGRVEDTAPTTAALAPETRDDRLFASNPANADAERAPGLADRRHRFSGSLLYATSRLADRFDGMLRKLVSDWMVSAIYTAESGAPYSAYVSADINGDRNRFNDLAPGTTRHQFRLPGSATLDARVARGIKVGGDTEVTLAWEAFNLLNRADPIRVNDTLYDASGLQLRENPLFGQLLEAAPPRMMQFAVRLSF